MLVEKYRKRIIVTSNEYKHMLLDYAHLLYCNMKFSETTSLYGI